MWSFLFWTFSVEFLSLSFSIAVSWRKKISKYLNRKKNHEINILKTHYQPGSTLLTLTTNFREFEKPYRNFKSNVIKQWKGFISNTRTLYMFYKSRYISFPLSTKEHHNMTKFCVLCMYTVSGFCHMQPNFPLCHRKYRQLVLRKDTVTLKNANEYIKSHIFTMRRKMWIHDWSLQLYVHNLSNCEI